MEAGYFLRLRLGLTAAGCADDALGTAAGAAGAPEADDGEADEEEEDEEDEEDALADELVHINAKNPFEGCNEDGAHRMAWREQLRAQVLFASWVINRPESRLHRVGVLDW